jgi:hypothetical protein
MVTSITDIELTAMRSNGEAFTIELAISQISHQGQRRFIAVIRDIEERNGDKISVVSEMLDARNQKLAEVTGAHDFIVSENLVSLLLAQLAENKALGAVFEDLFDADGAEIYLKDAAGYVALGEPVPFAAVVEAARRRGEIAIGFDAAAARGERGPRINPRKGDRVTFAKGDRVVVLASE